MCGKNLNLAGGTLPLLLGLSLLLLSALPLPLAARTVNPDGSVTYSADENQAILQGVKGLRLDLESLKQINNQQASKIDLLQMTIDQQAPLLTAQKLGLTDLTTSLESQKTINTIVTTAGIISLLGNIAQAIAYHYKP